MTAHTGIVARWSAPDQCPQCRKLAPAHPTGMLAVVIDTARGRRLVIAERTPAGRWAPTRHLPATSEAVRMLHRQDATGSVA